jgi:hypothetical protein
VAAAVALLDRLPFWFVFSFLEIIAASQKKKRRILTVYTTALTIAT